MGYHPNFSIHCPIIVKRSWLLGVAINFASPGESDTLEQIESFYSTSINELPQDFERHLN